MASRIPLYERHVQQTAQTGDALAPTDSPVASAIAGLGGTIANLGAQYAQKKKALKNRADLSDYEVSRKNLQTDIVQSRNDHLMGGGSYADFYDKVVAPKLNDFNSNLGTRGYGKESEDLIRERWASDSAAISQGEIAEREKMELSDYVTRIQSDADSVLSSGDFEGADKIYDDLEGIVGLDRVNNMKSIGRYNFYTIGVQGLEEQRLDGLINDNEYFAGLEQLRTDVKSSEMEMKHKKSIEISVNAKINNFKGKRNKALLKANDDVFEKIAKDELEAEDIAIIRNDVGEEMANALDNSMAAKLKAQAGAGDADAIKSLELLDDMVAGTESWTDVVKKIGDLNSSTGVLALSVANKYAKDIVNTQENFMAYENLFKKDQSISVDANTKNYVHTLTYYNSRKTDGQAAYINKKMKAFAEWQEEGDQTYEDFRTEQFGEDAKMDIMKLTAPQLNSIETQSKQVDLDSMTDEELEAYINE